MCGLTKNYVKDRRCFSGSHSKGVCIITFPISAAGFPPLANLINVICNFSKKVYVITSRDFSKFYSYDNCRISFYGISTRRGGGRDVTNLLLAVLKYFKAQLEVVIGIFALRLQADLYLFFIGGETLVLPALLIKLFRKKVVVCHTGSIVRSAKSQRLLLVNALVIVRNLVRFLADKILIYSKVVIREDDLQKFINKTAVAREHYLNFDLFNLIIPFASRSNSIGYVGRFTMEKGVLNFVEAIPITVKQMKNVDFVLVGDGPLFSLVNKKIGVFSGQQVKVLKWLPHHKLPLLLNKLRLLVLPSVTEGLPNVVLEAMACGTPVLATPVGAIPDIIKEGESGFLLKSNDPKHIAERIIELLNKPDLLEKVSVNAYNYVRENFSFEKTLDAWRKILSEL
jgi:glycosyltransferase involved in cell wall biosynthesis